MFPLILVVALGPLVWCQSPPPLPVWPDGFRTDATVIAFDDENEPHSHHSIFYYAYLNVSGRWHGMERHDHIGYCYGWSSNRNCTILITNNVYIVGENNEFCCMALPGNFGVPRTWLKGATWLGEEEIFGQRVNHWYSHDHEYWSRVDNTQKLLFHIFNDWSYLFGYCGQLSL
ncbi:unnamed protein product [Didymodactylos carnosus]|uniref:Uncharacterized protein n=1 Tax=Didymodactylos carnosus TaxID=1234261 RepID=A0A8S2E457_9BILA|nr:unnamed protein product [Didymodactylos carnosus]CAF3819399.1 unnamed protein product [Didymodactylos carnosus]